MATDNTGLFGMTPESYQLQQQQAAQTQAAQYAGMDPFQQANYGMYMAGNRLGGAVGQALGAQDPQLQKISTINSLSKQFDVTTAEGLAGMSKAIASSYPDVALQLAQKAQEMRTGQLDVQKKELSVNQEEQLRKELAALGPNASQSDIMGVVTKYGSADKVLAVLQASADKAAQMEQAKALAQERLDAQIQMAKDRGATAKEIAQMNMEGRAQIAQLTASLKGPSAAETKAAEKATAKAEGLQGLGFSLDTATNLINEIADKGGMTSSKAGGIQNLRTSMSSGAVGQGLGNLFGTEVQSKRNELKSVRLQLLNDIKQATGMSSQQLNSNMELKTWLDSLGSDKMTKEAQLAIVNNIKNRYLNGGKAEAASPTTGMTGNPLIDKYLKQGQ